MSALRTRLRTRKFVAALAVAVVVPVALSGTSARADTVTDYCQGQCADILPPGENGNATLTDILANRTLGTRPRHTADQLDRYASLVDHYTGLTDGSLSDYFNSSAFGVPPGQVESTVKPRTDVTIVRDKATGVPHIYGTTRSGTEFGAGYASGQDRLWLMDLFRHVGRAQLSGFAGGAAGNRALEQTFFQQAPYTEADLQAQIDRVAASGPRGRQAKQDLDDYIAGINAYITHAKAHLNFPGEYVLTNNANPLTGAGIQPFEPADAVAIAGVIGALFGGGGGGEVTQALVKLAAEKRYGVAEGDEVWRALREENDPEAVLTVHDGRTFPYAQSPAHPRGVAMPDPGSVTPQQEVYDATGSAAGSGRTASATQRVAATHAAKHPTRRTSPARAQRADGRPNLAAAKGIFDNGVLPADLFTRKQGMSNALLVSAEHAAGGHPVAVFGPQTGYFAPQLLMLEELQGPGISARGATFAGLGMYVLLGRGVDYSWSATSASQDITDTFALRLCNTDGSQATKDSTAYLDGGTCRPMEKLTVHNSWSPTLADQTAAGSYDLVMYRTRYGLVQYRATIDGKPVAYAVQRSTYRHEVDSVVGFQMLNDPAVVHSPQTFQEAVSHIGYTFNWFYADSQHIAYFNSGDNPVRADGVDPNLPVTGAAAYEWRGWDPATNTSAMTPASAHPQAVDQDYLVSWNNKQALQYTASTPGDGPVHRVDLLDARVRALVDSGTPVTRAALAKAMEEAAVADLRGEKVLPLALKVIDGNASATPGTPAGAPVTDPSTKALVDELRTWLDHGAVRKETAPGSKTYADAHAIQIFDAWWPMLVQREFRPDLGDGLFDAAVAALQVNESPSGGQNVGGGGSGAEGAQPHKGSSFQYGWWSYMSKDLRTVLGEHVAGPLPAAYCGGGDPAQCRQVLLDTLRDAANEPATQVYPGDADCKAGDQWCADSIIQRPMGGVTDYSTNWQNRPTYQQVVQYPAHRPA